MMEEHARIQSALQGDSRFRLLLEKIPNIAVQAYGADGTVQYWNKASENIYGYSEAEAIGKTLYDLIIPDAAIPFVKESVYNAVVYGIDIPPGELSLRHKNGGFVSVYSSHVVIRAQGEAPQLFCIDIDMKEQKAAEKEVRDLNEQLEQKVEVRTGELLAANQELTAMNEEMAAMNQTLEFANQQLEEEVAIRQQKEEELSVRERQNRAVTSLLIQPVAQMETLFEAILENALQLIGAPAGFIGLQDVSGQHFVVNHTSGNCQGLYEKTLPSAIPSSSQPVCRSWRRLERNLSLQELVATSLS